MLSGVLGPGILHREARKSARFSHLVDLGVHSLVYSPSHSGGTEPPFLGVILEFQTRSGTQSIGLWCQRTRVRRQRRGAAPDRWYPRRL
jgi:hypothetical protein